MEHVIRAIYENGVFKPLQRVQLDQRKICLLSIYPEEKWQKDFEALIRRIQKRTQRYDSKTIETDITTARAEAKSKRREARRPA